jgi:hypothetical protein
MRTTGRVVRDFIAWFDRVHGNWPDINVIYKPVKLDGTPTRAPARRRHRLDCDHLYADDSGRVLNKPRLATPGEMASIRPCKDCISASAKAAIAR